MAWLSRLREDIQTALDCDPAARTRLEVVLAYPGLHAISGVAPLALAMVSTMCSRAPRLRSRPATGTH